MVEEARVETLCVGEDVAMKAVEALKLWALSNFSYLPVPAVTAAAAKSSLLQKSGLAHGWSTGGIRMKSLRIV